MTESEEGSLKVLLEEMNDKFSLVLEGHAALDGKMERFHKESKEDHRLAMDLIKFSHDELKEEIQGVRTELKEEVQGVRTELREARDELKEEIQGVRTELKETRDDLSAKIEAVGTKVEGHEDRIRFLERKVA